MDRTTVKTITVLCQNVTAVTQDFQKSYMTTVECNLRESKICTTELAVQFLLALSTVRNVSSNSRFRIGSCSFQNVTIESKVTELQAAWEDISQLRLL